MPQIIATPINGARVRKPNGALLKAEGERVEDDSFWRRRRNDGDVTLTPAPVALVDADAATPAAPAAAAKTKK